MILSTFDVIYPVAELLEIFRKHIRGEDKVYLVGGVVRDEFTGSFPHDIDLIVFGNIRSYVKAVATDLKSPFFIMDDVRDSARIIVDGQNEKPLIIDFIASRGATIATDLTEHDFTLNAIAVDINDLDVLIDPLNGLQDIKDKILRVCSSHAMLDDPLRILRGIRLVFQFGLKVDPETLRLMKAASTGLKNISGERIRDELFKMLVGPQASTAVRLLDQIGALVHILPELVLLKGVSQSPPHTLDVWEHTLLAVKELRRLLNLLADTYEEDGKGNLLDGMASLQFGRFRRQLMEHFNQKITTGRDRRALLYFAGLYHDCGKVDVRQIDSNDGRVHYYNHEVYSAEKLTKRAKSLVLSNEEVKFLNLLVTHHMRFHHLVKLNDELNRRTIYRYFRDLGPAGVDLIFLSMADTLATYGVTITPLHWERVLSVGRQLLEAWYEFHNEVVQPPRLITGKTLIDTFKLEPGILIGQILSSIQEAQAVGQVNTVDEALALAKLMIEQKVGHNETPNPNL